MSAPLSPGQKVTVNRRGDLFMLYNARPFIDREVEVVKVTKSGLVQVVLDGKTISLPKRNLTPLTP